MSDKYKDFESFFRERYIDKDKENKGLLIWLIKWQINITSFFDKKIANFFGKKISNFFYKIGLHITRLAASSVLFFIPSYVLGYLLQEFYNYEIMTLSLILTLLWGFISPYLLLYAATILNNLLNKHKELFEDEDKWKEVHLNTLDDFICSNNFYFGFVWSTIAAAIVTFVYFCDAPTPIKVWSFASSFYLSFISSLGFHGVNTIVNMMDDVFSLEEKILKFNVNHPDYFGGFSNFDGFVVEATVLFASGTLIIPIGFDICYKCNNEFYIYLTIFLVLIYLFMIGYCFFTPLLKIKDFVIHEKKRLIRKSLDDLDKKERLIHRSLDDLDKMNYDFKDDDKKNLCLKNSIHIFMYYQITHSRLEKIKTNPWDFKSLLEFSLSVIVPSIVTIMKITKRL